MNTYAVAITTFEMSDNGPLVTTLPFMLEARSRDEAYGIVHRVGQRLFHDVRFHCFVNSVTHALDPDTIFVDRIETPEPGNRVK